MQSLGFRPCRDATRPYEAVAVRRRGPLTVLGEEWPKRAGALRPRMVHMNPFSVLLTVTALALLGIASMPSAAAATTCLPDGTTLVCVGSSTDGVFVCAADTVCIVVGDDSDVGVCNRDQTTGEMGCSTTFDRQTATLCVGAQENIGCLLAIKGSQGEVCEHKNCIP